ncbi:hypothetical protein DSO57_1000607 [Entomophthora muscae]|uniref:Uncharacterized protein n=1 Tax=Entomophthora muscae TaxID=34485 RepID=A0ACC2S047_9FUNG|nr:hypothetical protein DSO57_1000607 [Entomophthora muscae]
MSHFKILLKSPQLKVLEEYQLINKDWISIQQSISRLIDSLGNIQGQQDKSRSFYSQAIVTPSLKNSCLTLPCLESLFGKQNIEVEKLLQRITFLTSRLKVLLAQLNEILSKLRNACGETQVFEGVNDARAVLQLDWSQVEFWLENVYAYYKADYIARWEALINLHPRNLITCDLTNELQSSWEEATKVYIRQKEDADLEIIQWIRASQLAYKESRDS